MKNKEKGNFEYVLNAFFTLQNFYRITNNKNQKPNYDFEILIFYIKQK